MSPDLVIIGVDPGPIPGMCVLEYDEAGRLLEANALQVSHGLAATVFLGLLEDQRGPGTDIRVQVERYVVGRRSARSSTPQAGAQTRDLVAELRHITHNGDVSASYVERTASEVKPWASDDRLAQAGLMACTHQMRHARDSARHALFAAVKDGRVPDPLSKGNNR